MEGSSVPANRKGSIEWVGSSYPDPTIVITGGTGIFKGVQGWFTSVLSNMLIKDGGTLFYDYVRNGEMTFPAK